MVIAFLALSNFLNLEEEHARNGRMGVNDFAHMPYTKNLDTSEAQKQQTYASLFKIEIDVKETQLIRHTDYFSMPTSDNRFQDQIEGA